MIQLIITLAIVAAAVGVTVYRIIRWFSHPVSKCSSCALKGVGCNSLGNKETRLPR